MAPDGGCVDRLESVSRRSLGVWLRGLDLGLVRIMGLGHHALRPLASPAGLRLGLVPGALLLSRLGELVRRGWPGWLVSDRLLQPPVHLLQSLVRRWPRLRLRLPRSTQLLLPGLRYGAWNCGGRSGIHARSRRGRARLELRTRRPVGQRHDSRGVPHRGRACCNRQLDVVQRSVAAAGPGRIGGDRSSRREPCGNDRYRRARCSRAEGRHTAGAFDPSAGARCKRWSWSRRAPPFRFRQRCASAAGSGSGEADRCAPGTAASASLRCAAGRDAFAAVGTSRGTSHEGVDSTAFPGDALSSGGDSASLWSAGAWESCSAGAPRRPAPHRPSRTGGRLDATVSEWGRHVVRKPAAGVGSEVLGRFSWARRFETASFKRPRIGRPPPQRNE